jgi:TrmH family RNA methyltransferase
MSTGTVDVYNPKTVRATMGALYRMPLAVTDDLPGMLKAAQGAGIKTYAAYLGGSVDYADCHYGKGTAFLIGNEGNGLTDEAANAASSRVHIPMEGQIESLNAAMAAGILMFEASRQRRHGGM